MTLQTAWMNGAGEICCAVRITGTINPTATGRPIAYRQLIQGIALPIEVALSAYSGADDHIDSFAFRLHMRNRAHDRGLIIAVAFVCHLEIKAWFRVCWPGLMDRQRIGTL